MAFLLDVAWGRRIKQTTTRFCKEFCGGETRTGAMRGEKGTSRRWCGMCRGSELKWKPFTLSYKITHFLSIELSKQCLIEYRAFQHSSNHLNTFLKYYPAVGSVYPLMNTSFHTGRMYLKGIMLSGNSRSQTLYDPILYDILERRDL